MTQSDRPMGARAGRRRTGSGRAVDVLLIAGPAGSGKSTLGAALAARGRLPLLDLDTLTNPLLDALGPEPPAGHWNDASWRSVVRPARYACLLAVAAEQVRTGTGAILVAPFSAEMSGGSEWEDLVSAVAPAVPVVCWLASSAALRSARIAARAEPRDRAAAAGTNASSPPRVPHLGLDAALPTAAQVEQVFSVFTVPDAPAS